MQPITIRVVNLDHMIFSMEHQTYGIYNGMNDVIAIVINQNIIEHEIFLQVFSSISNKLDIETLLGMQGSQSHSIVEYDDKLFCHIIYQSFQDIIHSSLNDQISFAILSNIDKIS